MSLARPAPKAARNANSFSRVVARASIKFATLLHEISSNNPTAANTVYKVSAKWPITVSPRCLTKTVNSGG